MPNVAAAADNRNSHADPASPRPLGTLIAPRPPPRRLRPRDKIRVVSDAPRPGAVVLPFGRRHKAAIVRGALALWTLQALTARVCEVLLRVCDLDGVCWVSDRWLAQVIARSRKCQGVHPKSVNRSLRELEALGLLERRVVAPGRLLPRPDGRGRSTSGGRPAPHGGRIMRLATDEIAKGPRTLAKVGAACAGGNMEVTSRGNPLVTSSDPLLSLRERLKTDPAPAALAEDTPSAPSGPTGPSCAPERPAAPLPPPPASTRLEAAAPAARGPAGPSTRQAPAPRSAARAAASSRPAEPRAEGRREHDPRQAVAAVIGAGELAGRDPAFIAESMARLSEILRR
jgi:hypothetical protein